MHKITIRKAAALTFAALSIFLFCAAAQSGYTLFVAQNRRAQAPVVVCAPPETSTSALDSTFSYDKDTLWLTAERAAYQSDALTLLVPRLSLSVGVQNGTTDAALAQGVGLYDMAQLPNDTATNGNVSIAGHRGAAGCEFYEIDKLTDGDFIFLEYKGMRYAYQWIETVIVADDDWRPIFCRDYKSVTLTSCHPLNSNKQRICAIGKLVGSERIEE